MSEASFTRGMFCWADLAVPDMDAAARWYAALFGWSMTPSDPAMPYSMAMQAGQMIAGIGPMPPMMVDAGAPPTWTSYVWVDDCAATEAKAVAAGGTVLVPTMAVADIGAMAIVQDPTGAVIGLWQPGTHAGAELVGQPVSMCWNELMTPDVGRAKPFYAEVFGWEYAGLPVGDFDYTTIQVGGRDNGGMMPMEGDDWAGIPPHWMVYFAVDDTDAIAQACAASGGQVSVPPTDIPIGRFAVLRDPQGALFSIIALADAD